MDSGISGFFPTVPVCQELEVIFRFKVGKNKIQIINIQNHGFFICVYYGTNGISATKIFFSSNVIRKEERLFSLPFSSTKLKLHYYQEKIMIFSYLPKQFILIFDINNSSQKIHFVDDFKIVDSVSDDNDNVYFFVIKDDEYGIIKFCMDNLKSEFHILNCNNFEISNIYSMVVDNNHLIVYTGDAPYFIFINLIQWNVEEIKFNFDNSLILNPSDESLLFPLQKKANSFILFHNFDCKVESYLPFLNPVQIQVKNQIYNIIPCSTLNIQRTISCIFHDFQNVYFLTINDSNFYFNVVFFDKVSKVNEPIIKSISSERIVIKIPDIFYAQFYQSIKLFIINKTHETVNVIRLNCLNVPSEIKVSVLDDSKFKIYLTVDNGCGISRSNSVSCLTPIQCVPEICNNFKVKKDENIYIFNWDVPSNYESITHYVIEGFINDKIVKVFQIQGNDSIGFKAYIQEDIDFFSIYGSNNIGNGKHTFFKMKKNCKNFKGRYIWNKDQVEKLVEIFNENPQAKRKEQKEVALSMGVPEELIYNWFMNHKSKLKKK